jgi:hypothetical protein
MTQPDSEAPAPFGQWIKVEDRLPPKFANVLTASADGVGVLRFGNKEFHRLPGYPAVTHWMPLPEPPDCA